MRSKDDKRPDIDQSSPLLDFPDGDGDPNCEKCKGRGVTTKMVDAGGGVMWPGGTEICVCVYKRDLEANVKRIWPVLLNVESVSGSPLLGLTRKNLWITATQYDLRRHLRYTAYRMGPGWDALVVTDSKIITSWLSTAKYAHDPDVLVERERSSDEYMTIEDIAVPFDLLIIVLGVKAAKNREMPNVLLEAINERDVRGKPTWIVDSPSRPLQEGHICYNDGIEEILEAFQRVVLSDERPVVHTGGYTDISMATGAPRPSSGSVYTKRKPGMALGPRPKVPEPDEPPGQVQRPPMRPPMPRPEPAVFPEGGQRNPVNAPIAGAGVELPVELFDDDDMSVDALVAGAVDLQPVPQEYPEEYDEYPEDEGPTAMIILEDEDDDTVAEVKAYKPTADELGTDDDMAARARAAMSRPKPRGRRVLRGAFSRQTPGGDE